MSPANGTIGFGSGLHGWAFTLKQFADLYGEKLKIKPAKLMQRLWGDNFYNPVERKWTKQPSEGSIRGFNMFVLDPIYKVSTALLTIQEARGKYDGYSNCQRSSKPNWWTVSGVITSTILRRRNGPNKFGNFVYLTICGKIGWILWYKFDIIGKLMCLPF